MGFLRPATPGFIATLTATILLAVVSFCVPYLKSVYFLRADISVDNYSGSITFGTLGYCLELSNGTTCSKPSVGYELDINSLVDNNLPIEIPTVVVKWITYALVLHIVALALAAGSAVFGLLAHVREMSMACCSTCVSGFAAAVALLAFIFDIALFFIARSRINSVGSASIGNAIWLTLAAWILLFFSGCFYTLGRCCISKRKPRGNWGKSNNDPEHNPYADQMRLDAVKAEADRKAKQNQKEVGLPAFHEVQPLTGHVEGDRVYTDKYHDNQPHHSPTSPTSPLNPNYNGRPTEGGYAGGGYVRAPQGTSAMDGYYNAPPPQSDSGSVYPPLRQDSSHTYASNYTYTTPNPPLPASSPPPANNLYNNTQPYTQSNFTAGGLAVPGREYGHEAGGTSYHSAASHQQYPSQYSQYDQGQYEQPQPARQASYHDPYYPSASPTQSAHYPSSYYTAPTPAPRLPAPGAAAPPALPTPDRSYTLGGDGYGANQVPPLPQHASQVPFQDHAHSPTPPRVLSPGRQYDDQPPPTYEAGTSANVHVPAWGQKS